MAVMHQHWANLLFLHWLWDAEKIQRTLPLGLEVDTFEGQAWLGIVPFFMRGVRPAFLPPVPGISDFLELNVRTYVRDSEGNPGVWFYSLDCNQPLAVRVARTFFHLPYFDARMRAGTGGGFTEYHSRRARSDRPSVYRYQGSGIPLTATKGTLEQFLVERYRLFSESDGTLFSGEVWHKPYEISKAAVPEWCAYPIELAGFERPDRPPEHTLFSHGVHVRVYPLRRTLRPKSPSAGEPCQATQIPCGIPAFDTVPPRTTPESDAS